MEFINKTDFFNLVKPGDYIHVEFNYEDDNGEKLPGFCDGIVEELCYDWADEDEGYYPQDVIRCSKLITVDGIEPEDGDFYVGGSSTNKFRFMTAEEKVAFDNKFN